MVVRGDEDGDGAVDVAGDDTFVEGQRESGGLASDEHLAEEVLVFVVSTIIMIGQEGNLRWCSTRE